MKKWMSYSFCCAERQDECEEDITMKWTEIDKKQLKIYATIAFGIPFLLGLLMWYGSSQGRNMSVFPNAQMLYPAAGVMVLLLVTKKKEEVPRRFFISYRSLPY